MKLRVTSPLQIRVYYLFLHLSTVCVYMYKMHSESYLLSFPPPNDVSSSLLSFHSRREVMEIPTFCPPQPQRISDKRRQTRGLVSSRTTRICLPSHLRFATNSQGKLQYVMSCFMNSLRWRFISYSLFGLCHVGTCSFFTACFLSFSSPSFPAFIVVV